MGGGRSGLFHGTVGADEYQESLFEEPVSIRHRGTSFLPKEEGVTIGGTAAGGYSSDKLHVLTVREILKKFMDYRFGRVSESKLVYWLQAILNNRGYYIEPTLRHIPAKGLARLKATKTESQSYDRRRFLAEIEKIEDEILSE